MIHALPKPQIKFEHEWNGERGKVTLQINSGDLTIYFDECESVQEIYINHYDFSPKDDILHAVCVLVGYSYYSAYEIMIEAMNQIRDLNNQSIRDNEEMQAHYRGLSDSDNY